MLATKLIEKLTQLIEEHGDLSVLIKQRNAEEVDNATECWGVHCEELFDMDTNDEEMSLGEYFVIFD